MKKINYRLIQKKDDPTLAVLIRKVFREFQAHHHSGTIYQDPTTDHLNELFRMERSRLWVATVNEEVVGSCGIYPTQGLPKDCAELVKFYVDSASRGLGIGKKLFTISVNTAAELGYKKIYLESLPEFGAAVKMYEALGFEHLSKPLGNSGHFGCTIWMVKELS